MFLQVLVNLQLLLLIFLVIDFNLSHVIQFLNLNIHIPSHALWYFRLGHLSNQRLSQMHHFYPDIKVDNKSICDICHFPKQRKLPYTSSTSIASSNFELLHFDSWGPIAKVSIHGHRYFLIIVDDHSRFLWTILLKTKYEVPSHIQNFIHLIQT